MTTPERETAGAVRSAHVAHFLPPDWTRVARLATPALERLEREVPATQLLIIVPDGGAALALARALATIPAATSVRVVAATSAARARRLLATGSATVVIGAPNTLAPLLAASALKLDQVTTVLFAAADELDADDPDLSALLTEVPRSAARLLTALEASPGVESLLERHLHKARRMMEDVPPATDAGSALVVRYLAVAGSPVDALPGVLDEVDAPSATILASDPVTVGAARALLGAIGYRPGALANVTEGEVPTNSALVVMLGVPAGSTWSRVVAAQPAQIVAVIGAREKSALQRLVGDALVQPFATRTVLQRARAAEARARAELREVLGAGLPVREILALEPLLGEYDGLEIGAAALRLLEVTRVALAEARAAALAAAAEQVRAAPAGTPTGREDRGQRMERHDPPRGFGPRAFIPRGDRKEGGDRGPRSERGPRNERSERSERGERGERGDRPKAFGDRPRSFGDRPKTFGDRSDKPKSFGPRGDKPRGPRRDDTGRGPRGSR